ncbi:hypothetical protein [Piscinibacter sp. XHJ-5]|uniref:hypothetical protein n=1 Tax=Piscinibacter sp. XHJ-5 TaxID=3037797 RepID=UPI002453568E|nr:hypothetical protein [Piscinibacter sp. XHJ-5]
MSVPLDLEIGADPGVMPSPDRLRHILEAGIAAPSAENRHYVRFELRPGSVQLASTDLPTWSEQPHRKVLALIACGAVVENMTLRAAASGLLQATRWLPDPTRPDLIAECVWSACAPTTDALEAAIGARHTNRRFFRRKAVAPVDADRMTAAAEAIPGARLQWLDDTRHRSLGLQAIRIAEGERFRREALHHELFSAIRFELGWQQSADEGLPPGALEVEPPMRAPFAAMARWPLMRTLARVGVHHTLALRAADLPCRLAPRIGLILCDAPNVSLRSLGAGRALERAWLAATAAGLAFQPMAAAIALAHQRPGGGWVSEAVQQQIRDRLQRLTGGRAECACMFFRVGHAAPPSVVTQRPPIEHFVSPALPL